MVVRRDRMKVGYHASHEQFSPSELLSHVKRAEEAGFEAVERDTVYNRIARKPVEAPA